MSNCYVNDFSTSVQTYYKELKKYHPLSKEEEKKLILEAKNNNNLSARNKVLTSNLKFVFDVAKRYKGCGVSIDDLIAEGNIGLSKALDKFDIQHEVKFISYAVWWVRQSMQECIKKNSIKEFMEVSEDEELGKIELSSTNLHDEEDEVLIKSDVIFSNEEEENKRQKRLMQKRIVASLLTKLDSRGKLIISEYFGLEDKPKTLDEIGQKLNLSKERVRQIKEKSLRILRTEMLLHDNNDFLVL